MNQTTFQPAEIYDSNGNIIQQGAYGINTPFCTSTGDGVYDYIVNNLNALKDMIAAGYVAVATLPSSGAVNKYYVITEGANAGKCYVWTGSAWQELATQINGKSAYEIAVEHGFIGTEQQWLDSFTADAIAAANRAEAAMETIETGLETLEGIDARFANIEDHAEMTDSNVDATKKRISNVEKLLQGNLYDYQTDTDTAYTKTVPSGALPYAGIETLGGKTVVWNQAEPVISSADWEQYASTYTSVSFSDGVATVTVINDSSSSGYHYGFGRKTAHSIISGHVYIFLYDIRSNNAGTSFSDETISTNGGFTNVATNANQWYSFCSIQTANKSTTKCLIKPLNNRTGLIFDVRNVMLIDLTLLYGSGNEPSTVEEFQQMFPADYYEYNSGELLSAGVTEVVSKKADTTTLATYSIPAEVQALEGYGWSAGSVYNYIDYERKVFVQNVGRADLGSLDYPLSTPASSVFRNNASDLTPAVKYPSNNYDKANIVCGKYYIMDYSAISASNDKAMALSSYNNNRIIIINKDYTDTNAFKSAMSGVYLYYELAEPIETDISAYITDDNLVEVESGGTLTFENQHGDDYRIPVQSEETYMINLQEAVSNG